MSLGLSRMSRSRLMQTRSLSPENVDGSPGGGCATESTGTGDYFGVPGEGYTAFSAPPLGMPQVIRPDGLDVVQQRCRHPGAALEERYLLPVAA